VDALKWLPMDTTPRDTRYICLKPKPEHTFYTCPQVMRWDEDFNGWWLEEGAVYSDDDFIGWYPIPQ
jgi:hypothetical protein